MTQVELRPLERRVRRLAADGLGAPEIANRFQRSPEFIERVLVLSALPGRAAPTASSATLRPVERRILRWRGEGATHAEIAGRFQRSPGFIERVEVLARYKLAR